MADTTTLAVAAAPANGSGLWDEAGWLKCDLSVELPLHGFTVRDLLQLAVGSIVETHWKNGDDMPLRANQRQVAWIEFEALGDSLAVRVTELL